MTKTATLACALGCALAASAAAAQDPAAKPAPAAGASTMPAPAPEMQKLSWYQGRWTCTGAVNDMPGMKGHKTRASVTVHPDMNGFWTSGLVEEAKTAENPHPLKGMFHQTWDMGAKQFTMLWIDNMGGWASSTSPGWDGDSMAWTGEGNMMGQKITTRDSFTKKGEHEMTHRSELSTNGQWSPMAEETCLRAVPAPKAAAK